MLDSVNTTTYTYNKDGIRTCKVVVDGDNIITHEYFYDGNKLIAEKIGDDYFYFFYDESGVCGFRYENINYEYVKNIFGDIIGIYNEYGTRVATYAYDAWGNCTVEINQNNIANINPFRYRGYYFDTESGLYYLMSRYYDPSIGQFISMDTPDYLAPDTIGGVDLYAYCGNNPVMYMDPTGTFLQDIFRGIDYTLTIFENALNGIASFCEYIVNVPEKFSLSWKQFHKWNPNVSKSQFFRDTQEAFDDTTLMSKIWGTAARYISVALFSIDQVMTFWGNYQSGDAAWATNAAIDSIYISVRYFISWGVGKLCALIPVPGLNFAASIIAPIVVDFIVQWACEDLGFLDWIKSLVAEVAYA